MREHDGVEHGIAYAVWGEDGLQQDLRWTKANGAKERMAEAAGLWIRGGCLCDPDRILMLAEVSPEGVPDSHAEYFLCIEEWATMHPQMSYDFICLYYERRNI